MTRRCIASITPSQRKPGRFTLEVEGQQIATLSIDAIERLGLARGSAFDDGTAAAVEREVGILATYDRALNLLAARARASADLHRLLVSKGEPKDRVDAAIGRLEHAGFLDDSSFARQFTRSKVLDGGFSRCRVQLELEKRGVARDVAIQAIDAVFVEDGVNEAASIERIARKKLRTLINQDAPTRKRRLYAFLARRGYHADDIGRVMRNLLNEATRHAE